MKFSAVIIAFVCLVAKQVQADTPANCKNQSTLFLYLNEFYSF